MSILRKCRFMPLSRDQSALQAESSLHLCFSGLLGGRRCALTLSGLSSACIRLLHQGVFFSLSGVK